MKNICSYMEKGKCNIWDTGWWDDGICPHSKPHVKNDDCENDCMQLDQILRNVHCIPVKLKTKEKIMKKEYDFSKGERGKFYTKNAISCNTPFPIKVTTTYTVLRLSPDNFDLMLSMLRERGYKARAIVGVSSYIKLGNSANADRVEIGQYVIMDDTTVIDIVTEKQLRECWMQD